MSLRSVNSFATPGWVRITCGSFWKAAATIMIGMSSRTASNASMVLPPMKPSSRPAIISARLFTCGPPGTMVTSSPQAA